MMKVQNFTFSPALRLQHLLGSLAILALRCQSAADARVFPQLEGHVIHHGDKKYKIIDELGSGAYSKVYSVKYGDRETKNHQDASDEIVLKIMDLKLCESANKNPKDEFIAQQKCAHKNILQVQEYFETKKGQDEYAVIVMERCTGKNLEKYILELESAGRYVTYEDAISIMRQLFEALETIHAQGYGHYDVKPENIMFKSNSCDVIKLIDFGLCNAKKTHKARGEILDSREYMAPEILLKREYNRLVDIWAAGMVAYKLVTAALPIDMPFSPTEYGLDYTRFGHYPIHKHKIEVCQDFQESAEFYSLVKNCLTFEFQPDFERLSATKILKRINGIIWYKRESVAVNDEIRAITTKGNYFWRGLLFEEGETGKVTEINGNTVTVRWNRKDKDQRARVTIFNTDPKGKMKWFKYIKVTKQAIPRRAGRRMISVVLDDLLKQTQERC